MGRNRSVREQGRKNRNLGPARTRTEIFKEKMLKPRTGLGPTQFRKSRTDTDWSVRRRAVYRSLLQTMVVEKWPKITGLILKWEFYTDCQNDIFRVTFCKYYICYYVLKGVLNHMSIDLHIDTFFMFKGSCLLIVDCSAAACCFFIVRYA